MKRAILFLRFFIALSHLGLSHTVIAQRVMENLDRGVIAIPRENGEIFVSWRLLGTEPNSTRFHVYRISNNETRRLTTEPLSGATTFIDRPELHYQNTYFVRPLLDSEELPADGQWTVAANAEANNYIEIPLQLPPRTSAGDASVGDLDGDGDYEIVLKGVQLPRDSASPGLSGSPVLQAYQLDGRLMWTIHLGVNIREGEHDTQFMVYDLDADGKAELACRTSDGTVDGSGQILGEANRDWRDLTPGSRSYGKNLTKHEYLTVFDGETGRALASAPYVPGPEPLDGWGGIGGNSGNDNTGNRSMRFLACIAYLDGVLPSLVMCRGVYGRSVLVAWDWRAGQLTQRWVFDSGKHPRGGAPYITDRSTVDPAATDTLTLEEGTWEGVEPGMALVWDRMGVSEYRRILSTDGKELKVNQPMTSARNRSTHVYGYSGMGGHSVSVADVDEDGKDEIIYKAMVVDDDGRGLFTTGLRHGDALHVSDLDPNREGLEVYGPHENEGGSWDKWTPAVSLFSARDGTLLWSDNMGGDAERGLAADIDPRFPGAELWGTKAGLYSVRGEKISERSPRMNNFAIWWDGDELRELIDANRIEKWNWMEGRSDVVFVASGAMPAAGTKSSPVIQADLFGDWREEFILRVENKFLRIYTTTEPTRRRLPTLMHNPQYRLAIAWQNVSYNQPPYPSFFLGNAMLEPTPIPIQLSERTTRK
jgi:rhamnogalacturonan endolyase